MIYECLNGVFLLQWKEVKPEELMDSKLRCVFEFPDDKKAQSTEGIYLIDENCI